MTMFNTSKAIVLTAGIGFWAIMSIVGDAKFNETASFMKDPTDLRIKFEKRLDDSLERDVASFRIAAPKIIDLAKNSTNEERINGKWMVTKYTSSFGAGEILNIKTDFYLVADSRVMIGGNKDQVFSVTALTIDNEIRLVKKLENGDYEILEAYKVDEKKAVAKVVEETIGSNKDDSNTSEEMVELIVLGAHDSSRTDAVFGKDTVNGSLRKNGNTIEDLVISANNTSFSINNAELEAGDIFNTEVNGEMISGRLDSNGGEGKYRLTFFSGPLTGLVFEMSTEDALIKQEENHLEAEAALEDRGVDTKEFQDVPVVGRVSSVEQFLHQDEVIEEKMEKEEMDERVRESGYAFDNTTSDNTETL